MLSERYMWGFMGDPWQSTEGGHIIQRRCAPKRFYSLPALFWYKRIKSGKSAGKYIRVTVIIITTNIFEFTVCQPRSKHLHVFAHSIRIAL